MPVTKPFLLATSGATVDGRAIDAKMLEQMASSYDPKTYGARLNIEHIRGVSGESPFCAYGDVVSLSTGEIEVDFNGKKEKRTALYGVLDVNADAEKLNQAGQKVYPSVEIEPNFAGKGFAYLMGCALTDSPASIATDRLKFNRALPGTLKLASEDSGTLEVADAETVTEAKGLLASMSAMFDSFAAKFAPPPPKDPPADPADPAKPATFDIATFRPLFEDMGKAFSAQVEAVRAELRTEADALALSVKKVADQLETTPAQTFRVRPVSDGGASGTIKAEF
jgi:hypothetical protein